MTKSIVTDLLTGFVALGIVMAGFVTRALGQNLRVLVVIVGTLFLVAGLLRASAAPPNSWLKGVLITLGAGVPVCVMAFTGIAFTSTPHLIVFLATSWFAAIVGVHVRRLWRSAHRRASLFVVGVSVTVVILVANVLVPTMLERLSTRRVKYLVPSFSFGTISGHVTDESLRGRVAVLAFWATWCTPCREELPRLNALYQQYKTRSDVTFLAVADERDEDLASAGRKAKGFFDRMNLSLPLAISEGESSKSLGVHTLPTLLIIDQRGRVRLVHTGYDGAENLEGTINQQITTLLRSADL